MKTLAGLLVLICCMISLGADAATIDLSTYLPNVTRSATQDLLADDNVTRLVFGWDGQFWQHTNKKMTDKFQYAGYSPEQMYWFVGRTLAGGTYGLAMFPRYWNDSAPYAGTIQDSQLLRPVNVSIQWVWLGVNHVIRVRLAEYFTGSGLVPPLCTRDYYLDGNISTGPFPWQHDKGIRRYTVDCGGTVLFDHTYAKWVNR